MVTSNSSLGSAEASTAELAANHHIEEIRTKKFSIGGKTPNPLTQDLHYAVTSLSAELYTKDVHFLLELIQNAEDNEYEEGVEPALEFVLTQKDIIGCGASATLLVFNNEVGFSRENMDSICSVGRSTKKGKRQQGFIGEKGIGFKSVFLVSNAPHIVSNGYKVKFNEEPDDSCGIGYIVPQWVADKSFVSKIHCVYGSTRILPTTTLVLPLKPEKVEPVKEQLLELHPEQLLFLFKLKRLNVRGSNSYYKDPTDVCAVSISHETEHVAIRSKKAHSHVVQLLVKEKPGSAEQTCQYYIWRQSFPVMTENKINGREHVKGWTISFAFPLGDRLIKGTSSVGIFAFLPTAMVSNFPFIIQADFLLASSRESILLDSKWNLGILKCVPSAFVTAFTSCVKEGSPLFTPAQAFKFLPAKDTAIAELRDVRENIRLELCDAKIMPCETFNVGLSFCKPVSAVRILCSFRQLLIQMKDKGVSLNELASLKNYPIDASLDVEEYDEILDFLAVPHASYGWYDKCISACKLLSQVSENDYIDLLYVFAGNKEIFSNPFIMTKNLFKYIDNMGLVQLCGAHKTKVLGHKICFAMKPEIHAWLSTCNLKFSCLGNIFFLPNSTQAALIGHEQSSFLIGWLSSSAKIESCSVHDYCLSLRTYILKKMKQSLVLKFTQFLYHSFKKGFISKTNLPYMIESMPIIDGSNSIRTGPHTTLVCAEGSKWVKLFGPSNPFSMHGSYDLGRVYSASGCFAGEFTPENSLLGFLTEHTRAVDLPQFCPPNLALPIMSSKLTSEQAFLLLDWIRCLKSQKAPLPAKFLFSIQNGRWLKTYSGFSSPTKAILPNEIGKIIFKMTICVLNDLSVLDETFYDNRIISYSDELKYLGVTLGLDDIQKVAMSRFKSAASSMMSKNCVISLLTFIGFLKQGNMLDNEWLIPMREGRWLKTSQGAMSPSTSVFLRSESESEAVCRITNIPVIDTKVYGSKLDVFSSELVVLGVKCDSEVYGLIPENISFPATPAVLTNSCAFFILECIRRLQPDASSLIEKVQKQPWFKASSGYHCPSEIILPSPELSCLLTIVEVPTIDEAFYGSSIQSYANELKALGVALDFGSTLKIVVDCIRELLSSSKMSPSNTISLLQGIKYMCNTMPSRLHQVCEALSREALFKTRYGFQRPRQSILSKHYWASISLFVDLPIIDHSYYGFEIYDYQDELEVLGVIIGLEEGAHFVAKGLTRPIKAGLVTAEVALSLLKSIKFLMSQPCEQSSIDLFLQNITKSDFLRTTRGDRSPKQCMLLRPEWKNILQCTDMPFLDDLHYGNCISDYQNELKTIGVKVEVMEVCHLLSESLYSLTETSSVKRFYRFLCKYCWEPGFSDKADSQVWIPDQNGSCTGKWVSSKVCIVHDGSNLFGSLFHSLDKFYEEELLPIFPRAFGVVEFPGLNHYMQLWGSWSKRDNPELTTTECLAFWGYVRDNFNSETLETLKQNLKKLPAMALACMGIRLVSKEKLFVPDDLLLKRMFMTLDECPPFVWLPRGNTSSFVIPQILSVVYGLLGVKRLSESIEFHVNTIQELDRGIDRDDLRNKLISRGLMKIILGYLSSPKVCMDVKARQQAAKSVLNLSVSWSVGPIQVRYRLSSPGCKPLEVQSHKVVHWERKSSLLLLDKSSYENWKVTMEFGSYFSQELAEGLLAQEKPVAVSDLQKIIQLGFVYEFERDSVDFLLTRENLELLTEDEKFLDDAFPSDMLRVADSIKRTAAHLKPICPSTPAGCSKKQRR